MLAPLRALAIGEGVISGKPRRRFLVTLLSDNNERSPLLILHHHS